MGDSQGGLGGGCSQDKPCIRPLGRAPREDCAIPEAARRREVDHLLRTIDDPGAVNVKTIAAVKALLDATKPRQLGGH
jgi:hypothetical protein